jgi:membrane protein DedA with SNARE-associated domain
MAIETLVLSYGSLTVFIGTFLEGETILVLAAFAAHQGYLPLWEVILAAFLGSLLGDQLYFYLGRRHSGRILSRRPSLRAKIERANQLITRFRSTLILSFRFMYGLRTVLPFAFGMSSVPALYFILLNTFGAAAWAVALGFGGYFFGHALAAFIGRAKTYEAWGFGIIAAGGAALWLYLRLRRRRGLKPPVYPEL